MSGNELKAEEDAKYNSFCNIEKFVSGYEQGSF